MKIKLFERQNKDKAHKPIAEFDAEFRHYRRFSDQNEICQTGGHTSMSFIWEGRVATFVTRCSLKDKFNKWAARCICLNKALALISKKFKKTWYIDEIIMNVKDEMTFILTTEEAPRYWWTK